MTSENLPWHGLTAQPFLKFLLITQHEMPFINTSDATKRSSNRTADGKCTDVTNRRSHIGLSTPIDHFTVVDLVTWPLNGSEAGVDLVLIQTSLLLFCKSSCSYEFVFTLRKVERSVSKQGQLQLRLHSWPGN